MLTCTTLLSMPTLYECKISPLPLRVLALDITRDCNEFGVLIAKYGQSVRFGLVCINLALSVMLGSAVTRTR
jgi:hypothetical protein